jgi:hypothetical protein
LEKGPIGNTLNEIHVVFPLKKMGTGCNRAPGPLAYTRRKRPNIARRALNQIAGPEALDP